MIHMLYSEGEPAFRLNIFVLLFLFCPCVKTSLTRLLFVSQLAHTITRLCCGTSEEWTASTTTKLCECVSMGKSLFKSSYTNSGLYVLFLF